MKSSIFTCIFILFNLLISSVALSKEAEKGNFQKEAKHYFEKTIAELGIPGFAIVVTQGDKTILAEGYGSADFENQVSANSTTSYYIASATKSFTALLAVILNDEGVLKLDDPLQKYFPDLANASNPDFSKVTIRDLLTHTSGLENNSIAWRVAYSGEHDQSILLDLMKYTAPNEVGYGNYEYSNIGYTIYSIILEKVTGTSWQNWMQKKVFDPIGMQRTTAFISRAEKENYVRARPYIFIDSLLRISLEKKDNTMHAAGGLISTPNDMAKWLKVQVGMGKLNGKQIFPESTMISAQEELVTVPESERVFQPTHYGYGWLHGTYEGHKVIHHFGGFAGFSTHVSFMPDEEIGVTVMINEALSGDKLMNLVATFVYDFYLEKSDWSDYDASIKAFSERLKEGRKMMSAGIADRNNRPWLLSLQRSEYVGSYQSDEYGIVKIEDGPSGFQVSAGNLKCISTPFKNEDGIRVELIPGSGQVIEFQKENNKIAGLKYDGIYFMKMN